MRAVRSIIKIWLVLALLAAVVAAFIGYVGDPVIVHIDDLPIDGPAGALSAALGVGIGVLVVGLAISVVLATVALVVPLALAAVLLAVLLGVAAAAVGTLVAALVVASPILVLVGVAYLIMRITRGRASRTTPAAGSA